MGSTPAASRPCSFEAEWEDGQLPQEGAQPHRAKFMPAGLYRHSGNDSERGQRCGFFPILHVRKLRHRLRRSSREAAQLRVRCLRGHPVLGTEPRAPWASLQLQTRIWFLTSLRNVNPEIVRPFPEGPVMQRHCVNLFF